MSFGMTEDQGRAFLQDEARRMRENWPDEDRRHVYSGDGYTVTETVNHLTGRVFTMTATDRDDGPNVAWSSASTPWIAPGRRLDRNGRRQSQLYTAQQRRDFNASIYAARRANRQAAGLAPEVEEDNGSNSSQG